MPVARLGLWILVLLALPTLALSGCGPGSQPGPGTETKADPQEWIRPYAGYLPGVDEEKHSIFLVRDAISRRPIQGAVVTRHVESAAEMRPTDESPPTRVAEPGVCIEITLPTRR